MLLRVMCQRQICSYEDEEEQVVPNPPTPALSTQDTQVLSSCPACDSKCGMEQVHHALNCPNQ